MKVVGVLNTKGGVGKTTLTACLAVRAAEDGATAVVDLDPQSSYSDWYRLRSRSKVKAQDIELMTGADRATDAVEALHLNTALAFVFLDGPPGSLTVTTDAIKACSIVLIPIRASGIDLAASMDCIALCQEASVPVLVVVNDKGKQDDKLVEATMKQLKEWGVPVADTVVSHRMAYVAAMIAGKTGPETDKAARAEIDALWSEIVKVLKRGRK